jgi:hypothetical protein
MTCDRELMLSALNSMPDVLLASVVATGCVTSRHAPLNISSSTLTQCGTSSPRNAVDCSYPLNCRNQAITLKTPQ